MHTDEAKQRDELTQNLRKKVALLDPPRLERIRQPVGTLAVSGLALALLACGGTAADTTDASADACEASSPACPELAGGMPAWCTFAQAEQGICEFAEAGNISPLCSALSCGGGFHALQCFHDDVDTMYFYDPSGAFFAAESNGSGVQGPVYSGPCAFDAAALICNQIDAGCASGSLALDSGSPESAAD